MATNNVLHQLDYCMPESGENILLPRPYTGNSLVLTGATRLTTADSLPADGVIFDAANESALIPFGLGDDSDVDPGTARLRVQILAAVISGTSVSMQIQTLTGIYTGGASFAASVAAITPTAATQVLTEGVPSRYEFNLDADIRTALATTANGGTTLRSLQMELNCPAVAGAGILHVYDIVVRYGSMIVAATRANRE